MSADYNGAGATANTTRSYHLVDHADFDFSASNWLVAAVVRPERPTSRQLIISNGAYSTANSLNLDLFPNSNNVGFHLAYSTLAEQEWGGGSPTYGEHYLVYVTRRGNNLFIGGTMFNGSHASESAGIDISANGFAPTAFYKFGESFSAQADRFFQGGLDRVFIHEGHGMTLAEANALSAGALPQNAAWWNDPGSKFYWVFDDGSAATITDSIGGHVATRQGTNWGTNTASPYDSSVVKGLRITLPVANQTGLEVVVYDQLTLGAVATPVFQSNAASNDGAGLLELNIDSSTSQNVDDNCMVFVRKPDAGNHKNSLVHSGIHPIVDIA